jgi:hypothetical protein
MEVISKMTISSDQAKYLLNFCTTDSPRGICIKKVDEASSDEE